MIATSTSLAARAEERRPRDARPPLRPTLRQALRTAAPGSVVAARDQGRPIALVVLQDRRAFAVDDRCPHDGGWLSDGFLDGDQLVCARHGWEIDPCAGSCGRFAIDSRRVR